MSEQIGFLQLFSDAHPTIGLKAGDVLFRKGDPAEHMYVVRSGRFQIGEGNAILETIGPGSLFGEMALVDREPRSATIQAISDGEVIAVDQKLFMRMIQQTPYFALRVMAVMSSRLRAMNARLALG